MNLSLLGTTSRVETPYIKVEIGDYTFGVYHQTKGVEQLSDGTYTKIISRYPNYVQSLTVEKINGQVNTYSLVFIYPIRPQDDPNFFEKVFSSVNKTRKIKFSYGDLALPQVVYRNEEAIITNVTSSFDLRGGRITYTVSAVSSATLGYSGNYSFPGGNRKPSEVIRELLRNPFYGLRDIFYGMIDEDAVINTQLIPGNDAVVELETKTRISILEYLNYLVSCMIPEGSNVNSNQQQTFYVLTIHDEIGDTNLKDTTMEHLGGPYFKISPVSKDVQHSDAYEIDIGYPTANIVTNFSIANNETYSIYYNWQNELNDNDYIVRIDDNGKLIEEYSPVVSSESESNKTETADKIWWSKITQYPISATITLKGLLRPATLMQYVKLNVLFFGNKHISSGLYIVTKQVDQIDGSGYRTTLNLTRVVGEDGQEYDY